MPGESVRDSQDLPMRRTWLRDDIQGLRAVAVLAVVAFHAGGLLPAGFTGVDVFFVISGFVITGLLHRQWARDGAISFASFYRRRVLRLWPAAALMTVLTLGAAALLVSPLSHQDSIGGAAISASLLVANLYLPKALGNYFNQDVTANPFLHTWSLSVEEQFYLVFPLLLVLGYVWARRRGRPGPGTVWITTWVLAGVSFLVLLWLSFIPWPSAGRAGFLMAHWADKLAFYSPVTRAWEFAAGALVATASLRKGPGGSGAVPERTPAPGVGVIGAVLVLLGFVVVPEAGFPGLWALLPTIGTCLLLWSGEVGGHPGPIRGVLESRVMRWLGDRSYAWYLWHWPFIVFTALWTQRNPVAMGVAGVASLAVAAVTYRWVERPIHVSPRSHRWPAFAAVVAVTLILPIGAALAFMRASAAHWGRADVAAISAQRTPHLAAEKGCDKATTAGQGPGQCTWRAATPRGRMLLIGDSHAGSISEPFVAVANELGFDAEVTTDEGCGFLTTPDVQRADCTRFAVANLAALEVEKYDLVVVANASWGWARTFGQKTWVPGYTDALRHLARNHRVLVVSDTPNFVGFPNCLIPSLFSTLEQRCATVPTTSPLITDLQSVTAAEVAALQGTPVRTMSFLDRLCDESECHARDPRTGTLLLQDSDHLTVPFAQSLTPLFRTELQAALETS